MLKVLAGLLLSGTIGATAASHLACWRAFEAYQATRNALTFTDVVDITKTAASPTVSFLNKNLEFNGQDSILLYRTGDTWGSAYRSPDIRFDPQGDPRWIIEVLGLRPAEFLGFKILGDRLAVIPRVHTLNRQIFLLAERGVQSSVTFFEQAKVNLREALRRFGYWGQLPVASRSVNHALHDYSFHTGAILLSGPIFDFLKAQTRFASDFSDYLEMLATAEVDSVRAHAFSEWAYVVRYIEGNNLDDITGSVSYQVAEAAALAQQGKNPQEVLRRLHSFYDLVNPNHNYEAQLEAYVVGWKNAHRVFRRFEQDPQLEQDIFPTAAPRLNFSKRIRENIVKSSRAVTPDEFFNLAQTFSEQWSRAHPNLLFDPLQGSRQPLPVDEVCAEILARRALIERTLANEQFPAQLRLGN